MNLMNYNKGNKGNNYNVNNYTISIIGLLCIVCVVCFACIILGKYNIINTFTSQSEHNSHNDGSMSFGFLKAGIPTNYYMNPKLIVSPYKNKNPQGYWGYTSLSNDSAYNNQNIYLRTGVQL